MGQRPGSGVVYLNIFHGDIEDFISSKKPNADEKIRLATLSTGVIIPSIFFELMQKDKDIVLFSPYDIKKEYGIDMSEMSITDMYYKLLDNPNIRKLKRINARKLYTEIKKSQFESGYPFEMYFDNVNKNHTLKGVGSVRSSNLCSEILQVQTPSIIKDGNINNEYGLDVSCNLGSIEINSSTKAVDFEELVDTSMRLLTNVALMTSIEVVPSVKRANNEMKSVGLGVMVLHGHLIANDIEYGSDESIQFVDKYFEALNYYSLKTSNDLAFESGETFSGYEKSEYANGNYFNNYINKEDEKISDKVKKALGNVPIITSEMWKELAENVKKYGVFNSYRLAIAPTGSISYVRSSTASIAPITELVETRDYGNSRTIYPMPFLTNENKDKYTDAYNINQFRMIDLYATAQKHIDQGISMTLYVTDDWDTEKLTKLYAYAHSKNIKTVYYVRQRLNTLSGVVEKSIEMCESCSI